LEDKNDPAAAFPFIDDGEGEQANEGDDDKAAAERQEEENVFQDMDFADFGGAIASVSVPARTWFPMRSLCK
jgi:hypothetical protein